MTSGHNHTRRISLERPGVRTSWRQQQGGPYSWPSKLCDPRHWGAYLVALVQDIFRHLNGGTTNSTHFTAPKRAMELLARHTQRTKPKRYRRQQRPDPRIAQQMTPIQVLGKGAFAQVISVMPDDAGPIQVRKQCQDKTLADNERRLLSRLNHPNIVKVDNTGGHQNAPGFITMEYGGETLERYIIGIHKSACGLHIDGGREPVKESYTYIPEDQPDQPRTITRCYGGPLSTAAITSATTQVLSALEYLVTNNIIHRDIKPKNVLINPGTGRVKLADFGAAVTFDRRNPPTQVLGTLAYLAPEIMGNRLVKKDQAKGYGPPVDMFSAGCLFYKMFTGGDRYLPELQSKTLTCRCQEALDKLKQRGDVQTFMGNMASSNRFAVAPHQQQQVAQLLAGMLEPDPKRRLTPAQAQTMVAEIFPEAGIY